jgi:hypothetical protein
MSPSPDPLLGSTALTAGRGEGDVFVGVSDLGLKPQARSLQPFGLLDFVALDGRVAALLTTALRSADIRSAVLGCSHSSALCPTTLTM